MPYTINGIGTNLCKARGLTPWGDCDVVQCFTFFYVPLIPLKAMHTFNYQSGGAVSLGSSQTFQQIPIRWSLGLLARSFLRRWARGAQWIGGIALFVTGIGIYSYFTTDDPAKQASHLSMVVGFGVVGLALLIAGSLAIWIWNRSDCRNIDIRYALGCHALGSSDPATWTSDWLEKIAAPQQIFNTHTFAEAVDVCLRGGDYTGAMWAARLSAAVEDRAAGESLTEQLLWDPHVQAAIAAVRLDASQWLVQMTNGKGQVPIWPPTPVDDAGEPEPA